MTVGPTQSDRFCLECRHSLRGISSGHCPECGRGFDANDRATWSPYPRPFRWALARTAKVLIGAFGIVSLAAFVVTLVGVDASFVWIMGAPLYLLLIPFLIVLLVAACHPNVPLRRWQRLCGVVFPLLAVSIILTYWPFGIWMMLYRGQLNRVADQVQAGQPPAFPLNVGPFRIHSAAEFDGNVGLQIRPGWWGGTHLVRHDGRSQWVWHNTNWEFNLGAGWYYVYED